MKQFSPNAILALKEALTHIYWKNRISEFCLPYD